MIERIANLGIPIRLGYAGENGVLRVGFDLQELTRLFPGGYPLLVVKRPNDRDAYPVSLEIQDGIGWWSVSSADTAQSGYGNCQIHWYQGEQLAKTEQYSFIVNKALAAGSSTPPEAAEQWYDSFVKTVGNLSALQTEDKSSLVAAINELFDLLQNQTMPIASETQVGGILASDSISVDEDGRAHAVTTELSESMYATADEINDMMDDVFGE